MQQSHRLLSSGSASASALLRRAAAGGAASTAGGAAVLPRLLLLSRPPPFSFSRSFSSKLFVGGLSFRTQEDALRNAFAAHGEVSDVRIVMDRESGRSRGFGFVTFLSEEDAETAFAKMNGKILDGRAIRVDRASVRAPPPRPMGDSGGFNSGFNSGSGSSSDFGRSSSAFDSSPPVQEDWGTIPSFSAEVPQNSASSAAPESKSTDISSVNSTFDPLPPVASPPPTNSPSASSLDLPEIGSTTSTGPLPFATTVEPPPYRPTFDYGGLSSFQSSSYDDDPPLPRRKPRPRPRPISQSVPNFNLGSSLDGDPSPFGSTSEFETIAKPKGPEFDFGMSDISPPPSVPGARPQGAFDIEIPKDAPIQPPPPPKPKPLGFSIFPTRVVAPEGLPYDTPEADNWSDIGEDPPKLYLTSIYSPLRGFVSKDKELHWDPYNFDEDAKLPESEENAEAKDSEDSELSAL